MVENCSLKDGEEVILKALGVLLVGIGVFIEVSINDLLEIVWEGYRRVGGFHGTVQDCSAELSAETLAIYTKHTSNWMANTDPDDIVALRSSPATGTLLRDEALRARGC